MPSVSEIRTEEPRASFSDRLALLATPAAMQSVGTILSAARST
jgi:hypothetical protein